MNRDSQDGSALFSGIRPSLQLIDFGQCVDMTLFPQGKTFSHAFEKEELKTPDMIDGKSWSYQVRETKSIKRTLSMDYTSSWITSTWPRPRTSSCPGPTSSSRRTARADMCRKLHTRGER